MTIYQVPYKKCLFKGKVYCLVFVVIQQIFLLSHYEYVKSLIHENTWVSAILALDFKSVYFVKQSN